MLTLKKCKQILNKKGNNYTEEQVKQIRQFLYSIAEMDYKLFMQKLD